MLTLATAAWFLKAVRPGANVCILDLDLSGPVWQYLLFPERNRPSHFLNDILSVEQGNQKGDFEFPEVSRELIAPLLERSSISIEGTPLALISIADLPRTSRYLSVAVANNTESCFSFLLQLISSLQDLTDLVIVDNAPGFGSLPLLTHVLTTSLPHGCSAVVSTPALPDLRGSLIELSDLSMLNRDSKMANRPPIWIVNKADEKARAFLESKHSIVEVAHEVEAYSRILPDRPVIAKALSPTDARFSGLALPLDPSLLTFGNITNGGAPPLQDALATFGSSEFFRAFVASVGPAMLPFLQASS